MLLYEQYYDTISIIIHQESYESNKEVIVEKMISRMRTALEGSHSSIPPADEDTVDAMRAFTFLLNHLPHDELKKKVSYCKLLFNIVHKFANFCNKSLK